MCRQWGVANADEFYQYMRGLSDDELRAFVQEAWERVRRRKSMMKVTEVAAYG